MSKRVLSNREARKRTQHKLFRFLCLYFGDPGYWQKVGLGDAAEQVKAGTVAWSEVEQAIDDGWKPDEQEILVWLGRSEMTTTEIIEQQPAGSELAALLDQCVTDGKHSYPLYCPAFDGGECNIKEIADALAQQVEGQDLPDDFDPGVDPDTLAYKGGREYKQLRAHVRHEYTNYDELLGQLPGCGNINDVSECVNGNHEVAHWTIQRAASEKAESLLQAWLACA